MTIGLILAYRVKTNRREQTPPNDVKPNGRSARRFFPWSLCETNGRIDLRRAYPQLNKAHRLDTWIAGTVYVLGVILAANC